jgi:hypothetical protein
LSANAIGISSSTSERSQVNYFTEARHERGIHANHSFAGAIHSRHFKEITMGYTHYWERPPTLPRRQFVAAVADCRRLCIVLDIPLGDAVGRGEPVFTATEICFNGHVESGQLTFVQKAEERVATPEDDASQAGWRAGLDARAGMLGPNGNGSYEPFRIERVPHPRRPRGRDMAGWYSDSCKTSRRPYDLCVQGCLIVLNHHLGIERFRVASDGTSCDWNDARRACQDVLGYGINWGEGKLAPQSPSPTV